MLTALVIVGVGRCTPARMGVLAALVIVLVGCLRVVVAALVSTQQTTSVINNVLSLLPWYLHNKRLSSAVFLLLVTVLLRVGVDLIKLIKSSIKSLI